MTTNRKPRATREEMIERTRAKLARLEAEAAGQVDVSTEDGLLKTLRNRLRKTETHLRAARDTLYGRTHENGSTTSTIDEKIEKTKERLASQIETKNEAQAFEASLPFDIERLQAAIAAIEAGETDVVFPADLTRLPGIEDPRSDEQHEALFSARADIEREESRS